MPFKVLDQVGETSSNTPGSSGTITVNLSGTGATVGSRTMRGFVAAGYATNDTCPVHIFETATPSRWCTVVATVTDSSPDTLTFTAASIIDGSAGAGASPTWAGTVTALVEPIGKEAMLASLAGRAVTPGIRITPTANTPVEYTDKTAITTLYAEPVNGGFLPLFSDTAGAIPAPLILPANTYSVAVPSTIYRLFDVFVYNNSGVPALETLNWNQTTGTITAATNATPIVITSTGHGRSNGDLVGITGCAGNTAPNGKVWIVQNVTANTFELHSSQGSGADTTSAGTWYLVSGASRATGLQLIAGRYYKSGDATRLHVATGMTTSTSGQTEFSRQGVTTQVGGKRLLQNRYNRERMAMWVLSTSDNWASTSPGGSTSAFHIAEGLGGKMVCEAVFCDAGSSFVDAEVKAMAYLVSNSTNAAKVGIGINSKSPSGQIQGGYNQSASGVYSALAGAYNDFTAAGFVQFDWLERFGDGTFCLFLGDNVADGQQTGMQVRGMF